MERVHRGPRSKLVFLVQLAACVIAATASSPMTFDTYGRTPPWYGAIAPTSPFTRLRYRPRPIADFYYPRASLMDYYFPANHPMGRNDPPETYYYQPPRRAFTGRPYREERDPLAYDPHTTLAHQWRYHNPYFASRYFQQVRPPPWRAYRPRYTFFQSAIPSYSGFVSLPSRIYYPHFSHGGFGVGAVGVGGVGGHELRHPSAEQYLVFIPDMEEMSPSDDLAPIPTPLDEDEEVVHQPGMPQVDVAAPVDSDADLDLSHGADVGVPSSSADVTTLVYPTSVVEEVVSQSEGGNEASTESALTPNEAGETTPSEQMADHSTERPAQSEWPGSEISAVTAASTQGAEISEENEGNEGNESEVTTETEASIGEEHSEYVTEVVEVDKLDKPEAETKPVNENHVSSSESEHPQDIHEAVTESPTEDTTPVDREDEEVDETEENEATTEKAVYVQLHLLEQDAATATPTPKPVSVERRNASESSLFFLGLEMPSDQPDMEPSRDRIYKRYSDAKSQAKLSLDFKTLPVKPAFV